MRKPLIATTGHILTDGTIYGKMIYLAEGVDESAFYEITEEEYAAIIAEREALTENGIDLETAEKAKAYDILMGVAE